MMPSRWVGSTDHEFQTGDERDKEAKSEHH
jgi:hypothetical protein